MTQHNANSSIGVKSRFSSSGALRLSGYSHAELCALSLEARRAMYLEAVEADRMRLPDSSVKVVFSDLEFDPDTGEVFE